jgi:hypothetical protein
LEHRTDLRGILRTFLRSIGRFFDQGETTITNMADEFLSLPVRVDTGFWELCSTFSGVNWFEKDLSLDRIKSMTFRLQKQEISEKEIL